MTATVVSLLDINVDELFEQHSVAEIDQIHKQLQTNVEHKKEELRTMVGERYRDLLRAADTIVDMRTTATTVIGHIHDITATCHRLNEHQLIGFRLADSTPINTSICSQSSVSAAVKQQPHNAAERAVHHFHGLGVQIKLLAALPEMIWARIGAEDYFVATQLFTLSRHISTGLQLDVHRPLMRHFPIVRQLWTTLGPLYHTIRQRCVTALVRRELSTATATKCLASLLLLENCTADRLLGTLIQLRTKSFHAALADGDAGELRIGERLLASLAVLMATLRLVHECFVIGAIRAEVDAVQGPQARPAIELMALPDMAFLQKVPEIVSMFRPRIQLAELQPDAVRTLMAGWLQFTSVDCQRQIQSVIDGIASVKTVHQIRQQALATEKPSTWSSILETLYLPYDFDLYQFYYHPLINERVKQVIEHSWTDIIASTRRNVEQLIANVTRTDAEPKCANKWTVHNADIPVSLKQALSAHKQSHRLLMRSKGYTAAIVEVCAQLDGQLQTIHDDLSLYLGGATERSPTDREYDTLAAYLQCTSGTAVVELIATVRSLGGHRNKSTCVALATLLRAIVELCPNLKQCLQLQGGSYAGVTKQTWSVTEAAGTSGKATEWDRASELLANESILYWTSWTELFVAEQTVQLPAVGGTVIDYQHMAGDMLAWETHCVEEQDEHDRTIQSAIRVPAHVSVQLQRFWHHVCTQLTVSLVTYTLPHAVTETLCNQLTAHLLNVYAVRAALPFVAGCQTAALQFYFDVKFVQLVFVGRDGDDDDAAKQWTALAAQLKAHIDPFDFELFHKYLVANVKKAVQRMQHKLGILIANVDLLAGVLAVSQPELAAQDKEPNVLTFSTKNETTGYFSLLPVMNVEFIRAAAGDKTPSTVKTAAAAIASESSKPKRTKVQAQTGQCSAHNQQSSGRTENANPNLANVKSGAAAFFGAMSKDWFQ